MRDYTGQRKGTLTIIAVTQAKPRKKNGRPGAITMTARCDCGIDRQVEVSIWKAGFAQTCGEEACRSSVRAERLKIKRTERERIKAEDAERDRGYSGALLRLALATPWV